FNRLRREASGGEPARRPCARAAALRQPHGPDALGLERGQRSRGQLPIDPVALEPEGDRRVAETSLGERGRTAAGKPVFVDRSVPSQRYDRLFALSLGDSSPLQHPSQLLLGAVAPRKCPNAGRQSVAPPQLTPQGSQARTIELESDFESAS